MEITNAILLTAYYAALLKLAKRAPALGMAGFSLKGRAVGDTTVPTAAIDRGGSVKAGQDFRPDNKPLHASVAGHEILHWILRTFSRTAGLAKVMGITPEMSGAFHSCANVAHDIIINAILGSMSLPIGSDWLTLANSGKGYAGPLAFEPLMRHLWKLPPEQRPQGGGGTGKGCGQGEKSTASTTTPPSKEGGGEGTGDKDKQEQEPGQGAGAAGPTRDPDAEAASLVSAMISMPGAGLGSVFSDAIAPPSKTYTIDEVIRAAGSQARVNSGVKARRVMGAPRRRPSPSRVLLPGRVPTAPQIGVMIDVSGSMSRGWVANAVATVIKWTQSMGLKLTLVTHTSHVCWAGKVGPRDEKQIIEASMHTGGTAFAQAYAKLEELAPPGGYDIVVHFTDCDGEPFPKVKWPLVVGAFGCTTKPPVVPETAKFYPMEGRR